MTTILEAIATYANEGLTLAMALNLFILWRKHLASKKMRRDIEAIKKAVGAVCVDESSFIKSMGNSSLISSWAGRLSVPPVGAFTATGLITYLRRKYKVKSKLMSRKFLLAISTGIIIALNDALGWGLSEETITSVCVVVVGYIAGEAVTDVAKVKSNGNGFDDTKNH